MAGFDMVRLQRVLLGVGALVVIGLWTAEEFGILHVAPQPGSGSLQMLPPPPGLVLQATIPASGAAPGMAILADGQHPPVLVPEGASFNEQLRVDRVLNDRVVLRHRGLDAPMVLIAGGAPSVAIPPAPARAPQPAEPAVRVPAPR